MLMLHHPARPRDNDYMVHELAIDLLRMTFFLIAFISVFLCVVCVDIRI